MNIPRKWLTTGAVVGLLALLIGVMYLKADDKESEAGGGEKIALAQLPLAVRTTMDRESQGGTLKEVEKITEGGKTMYGAEIVVKGEEQELFVAENGTVIQRGKKEDDD